jgi:molybdopterin/thiamine biosynthesis adenylyltransferase
MDASNGGEVSEILLNFDYIEAFSRNIGLVSDAEQAKLRATTVAIAGLGGVGGAHVMALARLGVGRFTVADLDRFELANMNRQVGAITGTLGRSKVEVVAEMVTAINPTATIREFKSGIDIDNIDDFLDGAIVAVDGIDFFNIAARRLLFRRARARGVYALTSAPIGFSATLQVFSPTGMSYDEYFDLDDRLPIPEQILRFGLGLAPKMTQRAYFPPRRLDLRQGRAPFLGSACLLSAALVATEVANLVLKRRAPRVAPEYFQFDPLVQQYKRGQLRWGNRGPIQRLKRWWVLRTNPELRAAVHAPGCSPASA